MDQLPWAWIRISQFQFHAVRIKSEKDQPKLNLRRAAELNLIIFLWYFNYKFHKSMQIFDGICGLNTKIKINLGKNFNDHFCDGDDGQRDSEAERIHIAWIRETKLWVEFEKYFASIMWNLNNMGERKAIWKLALTLKQNGSHHSLELVFIFIAAIIIHRRKEKNCNF